MVTKKLLEINEFDVSVVAQETSLLDPHSGRTENSLSSPLFPAPTYFHTSISPYLHIRFHLLSVVARQRYRDRQSCSVLKGSTVCSVRTCFFIERGVVSIIMASGLNQERVAAGVQKIVDGKLGVQLPAQEAAQLMANLTFKHALIAIAVATLLIPFLFKGFLRSVYFAYKGDQAEKEEMDSDDEEGNVHFRPWYSSLIPVSFSLTAPFAPAHADEEDSDDDGDSVKSSPKSKSGSPKKKASSARPRSRSPAAKGSKKAR